MGSGYSKMKKKAKLMQAQMEQFKEEMKQLQVTGQAGNGLVKILMNGEKELLEVSIQPDCVDKEDIEGLQDLIIEAFNDAMGKINEQSSNGPELF